MKLLLMAHECSPYRGSEWAVGWGRLLGAAKVAETHVITTKANFADLQRARAEGLVPENVNFYAPTPDSKLEALDRKPILFAYNYTAYRHWQRRAYELACKLHAEHRFDVAHQVNVCTFREPGYVWQLDIPFLWGPVGGTQNYPWRFLPMLPAREAAKEGARSVTNWLALHKPRVRKAAGRAAEIIGANSTNQRDLQRALGLPIGCLLETGLHVVPEPDRTRFQHRVQAAKSGNKLRPLHLLWSGEMQTRKALPVLLQALARVGREIRWQLDVLGDGPLKETWRIQSQRLGLADRVRFLGRVGFTDAVEEMRSADLFCFTSLRDTSGNVVLEALSAGVPVLCFEHQGAGDMVSEISGIKLPVRSPDRAYADWAHAIERLALDPDELLRLSYGATVQASAFLWSRNHEIINASYARLAHRNKRPPLRLTEIFDPALELTSTSLSVQGTPR